MPEICGYPVLQRLRGTSGDGFRSSAGSRKETPPPDRFRPGGEIEQGSLPALLLQTFLLILLPVLAVLLLLFRTEKRCVEHQISHHGKQNGSRADCEQYGSHPLRHPRKHKQSKHRAVQHHRRRFSVPLGAVDGISLFQNDGTDHHHDDLLARKQGKEGNENVQKTGILPYGLLEEYTKPGCRMLDVGTGSGILAICASKLGAGICRAYDIDPMSVRVANENIRDSGLTNITCEQSDLLRQVDLSDGPYDLICANIVADIIIRMTPDVGKYLAKGGVLLVSGIIVERSQDVIDCLLQNGFRIEKQVTDNGWCALAVRREED